ncbi:MAG: hypothetical protein A3C50_01215 [Candidatus Staskawiczbacteria bacterium RIFCSPHIGHO2_02_FULL_43_16]|uniref:Uncharacterized protein n=1 Tax=Candidatus Staskawiczbacteria bacterium RIFCSPHIGHO2_01_FULL_41_41 TaxID=1802203 RepID=A0A1G2HVS2_9BACT|nr:MAG: hypothetical protein A2822_04700 [Candidatus Staskawiczbacteria bacterium RIFCSPHIGHO2_01_FULL_41_41]OGZ68828.1 MAG: hypothetical protein A3C50_01215 [Candidatus Staskawiczbacteria bacterium RIFCSPHIGHO2_02_FULL_43_16]OGZ74201.1 MAG: hypothetical protein A3A12_00205 [Candidatus Staskawiczbacteria bacterium RIFCSPLOWO2_01_FULL_43_17b]
MITHEESTRIIKGGKILVLVTIPGTGKCKPCDVCHKNEGILGITYDLDKTTTVFCKDGSVYSNSYPDLKVYNVCKDCAPPGFYEKYYDSGGEIQKSVRFNSDFGGA